MNRRNFIKILAAPAIVASTGVYRPGWCAQPKFYAGWCGPNGTGEVWLVDEANIGERLQLTNLSDITPPTDEEMDYLMMRSKAMIESDVLDRAIATAGWQNTRKMLGLG